MEDYAGNSKKSREQKQPDKKEVKRVTKGEVLIPKKSVFQKFKESFLQDNLQNVTTYVLWDVMVPAFKNMIWDALSSGSSRMMYGDGMRGRINPGRPVSHTTYSRPINRGPGFSGVQDNLDRRGLPQRALPGRVGRGFNTEFIVSTREEAEAAMEQLTDLFDQYRVISVGDVYATMGEASTPVDEKWGWEDLSGVQIRQVREGILLYFPQPVPL